MSRRTLPIAILLAAATLAGARAPVLSGPPMICGEIQVDSEYKPSIEKLLSTGQDPIGHSLAALSASPDYFSHMEIVRLLCLKQRGQSDEIVRRLMQRVVDGEAVGKVGSNEWLDLAYAVGCLNQLGDIEHTKGKSAPGEREGIPGYWYILHAISLADKESRGPAGPLHFAAALMTHPVMFNGENKSKAEDLYRFHMREAVRAMTPGSLLERNLQANLTSYQGAIERAKSELAAEHAAEHVAGTPVTAKK